MSIWLGRKPRGSISLGALALGTGGGSGPAQSPYRAVSLRQRTMGDAATLTGGRNIIICRTQAFGGAQAWAQLKAVFGSWLVSSAALALNKEQAGPQGFRIIGAAVEKRTFSAPATVCAPLYFNGQREWSFADGDSEITTDDFFPAAFPSSKTLPVAMAPFWRAAIDVGANGSYPGITNLATSLTAGLKEGTIAATSSDDALIRSIVDGIGDVQDAVGSFADGVAVNAGYAPIRVIGLPLGTVEKDMSIIGQGSSFPAGSGDGGFTGSGSNGGFLLRGGWNVAQAGGTNRRVPILNYGRESGMWAEIANSNSRRERAWPHARIALLDGPTNDVGSSISAPSILASWDAIRARLDAFKLLKIVTLVAPRTNGDNTAPLNANWATGGNRDSINAALISRWQAGEIHFLIDPNLGRVGLPNGTWVDLDAGSNTLRVQSVSDPQLWFVGTSGPSDWVHPNATGHGIEATLLDYALEYIWTNYGAVMPA